MDKLTPAAAIRPLRQRLIDDMSMRRFSRETQGTVAGRCRCGGRQCELPTHDGEACMLHDAADDFDHPPASRPVPPLRQQVLNRLTRERWHDSIGP
jgi:hypothetical protein